MLFKMFTIMVMCLVVLSACGTNGNSMDDIEIELVSVESVIERDEDAGIGVHTPDDVEIGKIMPLVLKYQVELKNIGGQDIGDSKSPIKIIVEPREELSKLIDESVFTEDNASYTGALIIKSGESETLATVYILGSEDTTGLDHNVTAPPKNIKGIEEQALNVNLFLDVNGQIVKRIELNKGG